MIFISYFEVSLFHEKNGRKDFDISVNEGLYYYLICHHNAHSMSDDWFVITLKECDVKIIQALCKTNEEKELIGQNVQTGSIIDILIHRTILIGDD